MFLMSTAEKVAVSVYKFVTAVQPIGLGHLFPTMRPLGLYRVESRALLGKQADQFVHSETSALTCPL